MEVARVLDSRCGGGCLQQLTICYNGGGPSFATVFLIVFLAYGGFVERTLIILKPDALQRGLIGPILARLEARGLKFIGLKLMQVSDELAHKHYGVHEGKPFFTGLVSYITSSPVLVGALEGKDVIEIVRSTVGATNPVKAAPGTIRGDFGVNIGRNLIHASDSAENGQSEVALFFAVEELISAERSIDQWVTE